MVVSDLHCVLQVQYIIDRTLLSIMRSSILHLVHTPGGRTDTLSVI
jgi:hypothetical protein